MSKIQGIKDDEEEFIIREILKFFPNAEILAFGSRVKGHQKKFSDIDLCIKDKSTLDRAKWAMLEESFAESDLHFIVDLSDYHLLTEEFRRHIFSAYVKLN